MATPVETPTRYAVDDGAASRAIDRGKSAVGSALRRAGLERQFSDALNRLGAVVLPDEVAVTVDGTRLLFRVSTRFEWEQFRKYESSPDGRVLSSFADDLRADDTVWDVGANVGVFTLLAAARLPRNRVVAVEPNPDNVARLRQNLARNGHAATVERLALSDESGSATLSVSSPSGTGAFGLLGDEGGGRSFTVSTETGDALGEERLPAPTVLKVDVQGSELSVLRGLRRSLESDCRVVYCNVYEKHFTDGTEGEELESLLGDAGFRVERLGAWDGGYFVRAVREE